MKKKWLLEQAKTPVYQRIIHCLSRALQDAGQVVWVIDPARFQRLENFIREINTYAPDFILITNLDAVAATCLPPPHNCFVFEHLPGELIFIHHDNLVRFNESLETIERRFLVWRKVAERSHHFCLEKNNLADLQRLGIRQSHPIQHATEFVPTDTRQNLQQDVGFVGHILPGCLAEISRLRFGRWLKRDYLSRIKDQGHLIDPSAERFAQTFAPRAPSDKQLGLKYFYLSYLHGLSQQFRGEIISRLPALDLHIFGGDPAYLHKDKRQLCISKAGVHYHPPTRDPEETRNIYAQTRINLNITPLQFDHAVINRVLDVAAAGGFILTDYKSGLEEISQTFREVTFKSPEDLSAKIDFFLAHPEKRKDLAQSLSREIRAKCTYQAVIREIMSRTGQT